MPNSKVLIIRGLSQNKLEMAFFFWGGGFQIEIIYIVFSICLILRFVLLLFWNCDFGAMSLHFSEGRSFCRTKQFLSDGNTTCCFRLKAESS